MAVTKKDLQQEIDALNEQLRDEKERRLRLWSANIELRRQLLEREQSAMIDEVGKEFPEMLPPTPNMPENGKKDEQVKEA